MRTNYGEMSENQISMLRERIRSVGISILGGNGGIEGKYELGIDSVRLVNEEDIESPLGVVLRFTRQLWLMLTLYFRSKRS